MSSTPCPMNLTSSQQCRWPRPLQHPAAALLARPAGRRAERLKARVLSSERPGVQQQGVEGAEAVEESTSSESAPLRTSTGLPEFESYENDSFFPKRQPGSFPSPAVRVALSRLQTELLTGADTGSYAPEGQEVEFDPLRDGPARYLGYSNELGEAFAAWLPAFGVPASYAVAITYVLVDTVDKGIKAYGAAKKELDDKASLHPDVDTPRLEKLLAFERTLDTVVWQLLASVACPGYTIHTVVELSHAILKPIEASDAVRSAVDGLALSLAMQGPALMDILDKSLPTAAGLAAIPFIVHPIDNAIHAIMNVTLRPAMRSYICGPGQGCLADLALCNDCKVVPKGAAKH